MTKPTDRLGQLRLRTLERMSVEELSRKSLKLCGKGFNFCTAERLEVCKVLGAKVSERIRGAGNE